MKQYIKESHKIPNYRMIKVSFLAPTNTRGSRVKIYETNRYNDTKTKSKIFSYSYKTGDVLQQAINILERNGFNIVCRASEFNNYVILCDNWADEFIEVNNLK
jgi:hypothetical protein